MTITESPPTAQPQGPPRPHRGALGALGVVVAAVLVTALSLTPMLADRREPTATAPPATVPASDEPALAQPETDAATYLAIRHGLRAMPAEWPIVRGIYATRWSFAGDRWHQLMDIVRTTEVNAVVIDVKDDDGQFA